MDLVTALGLFVGMMALVGGMLIEGGHLSSILQLTAGIIVFGGTLGAVLVSTTKEDLRIGLSLFKLGFTDVQNEDPLSIHRELIEAAQIARRDSILALEKHLKAFSHPFMREVFRFVIDGVEPAVIRDVFEVKMNQEEEKLLHGAKIYTDAGGYAPTIGIIGAVLGLIHVMSNLSETSKLGAGIAVAFVATIYGVGSANLIFLPLGTKIKRKIKMQTEVKAMILEGALGVMAGLNPQVIDEKLKAFSDENSRGTKVA